MNVLLTGGTNSLLRLIVVLLLFVFVLFITAFTTKWIANYQQKQGSNMNMEIVEGLRLSPNKFLQIVRVGDKYVCIAVGKDEVTYICDVNPECLTRKNANDNNFSEAFGKALSMLGKKDNTENVDDENKIL